MEGAADFSIDRETYLMAHAPDVPEWWPFDGKGPEEPINTSRRTTVLVGHPPDDCLTPEYGAYPRQHACPGWKDLWAAYGRDVASWHLKRDVSWRAAWARQVMWGER